jgi:hypothetical protein
MLYQRNKAQIDKVDEQLKSLDRKDRRRLLTLIRSVAVRDKDGSLQMPSYYDRLHGKKINLHLEATKEIIALYLKAGVSEEDYNKHWEYNRIDQVRFHFITPNNTRPARQDNKDFINTGSAGSNANVIRFPKKARKTAWKRFYRLFPSLKPQEEPVTE